MLPLLPPRSLRASIYLAALIVFQSVGWLLAWQGLQLEAKSKAEQALLQAGVKLQECTVHKAQLQEIALGKNELLLNGQLFDYRIVAERGDSIRLSLYHDREEETLFAVLHQLYKTDDKDADPSSTPMTLWLAKWLGSAYLLPRKPHMCALYSLAASIQNFTNPDLQAQSKPEIYAPPPEAQAV